MLDYQSDLPARDVDRRLRDALTVLRRAEQNAVLWFAEVLRRKLYRELGYGSIQQYAELALGFGPAKTAQFIRLAGALEALPGLRGSLRRGEVTWTQARTVAAVATPKTEGAWVAAARRTTSRGLEATVRAARVQARTAEVAGGQGSLILGSSKLGSGARGVSEEASDRKQEEPVPVPPVVSLPVPRDVHLRFSPEQAARYEALLEAVRKQGARGDRTELVLAGLEALVCGGGGGETRGRGSGEPGRRESGGAASGGRESGEREAGRGGGRGRRHGARPGGVRDRGAGASEGPPATPVIGSPYQILVQLCPSCAGGAVVAGREPQALHPRELRAILCDARIRKPGERNRAVIPPRVRRAVLERDGYRCRGAGCRGSRFLAVHHLSPRAIGGSNDPANLITLCAACHRAVHVVAADGAHAIPVGKVKTKENRSAAPAGGRLSPAAAG